MALKNLPKSILGEGPVWDPDNNTLYWVDIVGGYIRSYRPIDGVVKSIPAGPAPSCIMLNNDGNLVVTLKDRIVLMNPLDGSIVRTLAIIDEGPENRFNDCRCDPTGRLVAGTMNILRLRTASLYIIDLDLTVRRLLGNVGISNGISWSQDGSTMYYIDTVNRGVSIFRYNLRNGTIEGELGFIDLSSLQGNPDGMTIDSEGNLWVAMSGGGRVIRVSPVDRRIIGSITVNARYTTSCTFGGENLDTLYVTTAMGSPPGDEEGYLFEYRPGARGVRLPKCKY